MALHLPPHLPLHTPPPLNTQIKAIVHYHQAFLKKRWGYCNRLHLSVMLPPP